MSLLVLCALRMVYPTFSCRTPPPAETLELTPRFPTTSASDTFMMKRVMVFSVNRKMTNYAGTLTRHPHALKPRSLAINAHTRKTNRKNVVSLLVVDVKR